MQTLAHIKQLLAERNLAPRKALGQNFLIDHNLIRKLADAAQLSPGDLVLEVGPGTGALTEELLDRSVNVVACELDRGLAALLRERFCADPSARPGRLDLIEGDCLETKRALNPDARAALAGRPFKLVANLPYGAATPLITTLLVSHPECSAMFVTVQREVADRLAAVPSTKEYGPLSVIAQAAASVARIANLPPECFWPRPDVTSAMASVTRHAPAGLRDLGELADFVASAFAQRRKQLGSVLGKDIPWPPGILPTQRAEELSVDQFIALSHAARRR